MARGRSIRSVYKIMAILTLFVAIIAMGKAALAFMLPASQPGEKFSILLTSGSHRIEFVSAIGGPINAIALQGQYAYIGSGAYLTILDVSNPANPTMVGQIGHIVDEQSRTFPGIVEDIVVVNRYAYVVDGEGLRIIDVSDISRPYEVTFYKTEYFYPVSIALFGSYAYVGGEGGWKILDISDFQNVTEIYPQSEFYGPPNAWDIVIKGSYAYVAAGSDGLWIIDISDPYNLNQIGVYYTAGFANAVAVSGTYAYVTDQSGGVYVIDISNPRYPQEVGFYGPGYFTTTWDVVVSGDYVYIADDDGLRVIDVSNPRDPREVNIYTVPEGVSSVAVTGVYAYMGNRSVGLQVLNVSDLQNIQVIGTYNMPYASFVLDVYGDYVYVVDFMENVHVIDVSNPYHPQGIGFYDPITVTTTVDVSVVGSYAYVADYSGIRIIDVSEIRYMREVSYYGAYQGISSIAISNYYAYLVSEYGDLYIIDISDPANAYEVGAYYSNISNYDVEVSSNYAYVASGSNGLVIINVSDPSNPYQEAVYDTPGIAVSVVVKGSYAYVADELGGLRIIDISNPQQPRGVSVFDTPGQAVAVAVSDSYAYVLDQQDGFPVLYVVDVSNPAYPEEVAFYSIPAPITSRPAPITLLYPRITVYNSYIYVPTDYGLFILRFGEFGTLKVETEPGLAKVFVDGEFRGVTPSQGYFAIENLSAGDHMLTVTKEGYQEWNGIVTVPAGSVTYKAIVLQRAIATGAFPQVSLEVTPNYGSAPLDVTFTLSAQDSDGQIAAWLLDADGDARPDFSGLGEPPRTVNYTYTEPGEYTAIFMVNDNEGNTGTAILVVNVGGNQPPQATLNIYPQEGVAPLTVFFTITARDADGTITTWALDPGDGTTSYGGEGVPPRRVQHTYTSPGKYVAVLAVSDDRGTTQVATVSVNIYPATGYQISGIVRDENGQPIAGAVVEVIGPHNTSSQTDNNGAYSLHNLPAGTYTVKVSKSGFYTTSRIVSVPPQASNIDFYIKYEKYTIDGIAVDDNGNPLSNVTVTTNAGHVVLTGKDGRFSIGDVYAGEYLLMAEKEGYVFSPSEIFVAVPPSQYNIKFTAYQQNMMYINEDLKLAQKYAPIIYLHEEETYRPDNINAMLKFASLMVSTNIPISKVQGVLVYNPPILPVYLANQGSDLYLDIPSLQIALTISDLLSPYIFISPIKALLKAIVNYISRLHLEVSPKARKFYNENIAKNEELSPTVYARVWRGLDKQNKSKIVIQYWLFYFFNDGSINIHEGDWEFIQVVLNDVGKNPVPEKVLYSRHGKMIEKNWDDVEKEDNHPKVYVSLGSHANYFKEGVFPISSLFEIIDYRPFDRTGKGQILSYGNESGGYDLVLVDNNDLFDWLRFNGRWGEYFWGCSLPTDWGCGPTGPNTKKEWNNPLGDNTLYRDSIGNVPFLVQKDEESLAYTANFRATLTPCTAHALAVQDDTGQRLTPVLNEIDPLDRAAEYIRSCTPEGSNRHTILIYDNEKSPMRLEVIPDPLFPRFLTTTSWQQTVPMTLEVSVPYPSLNLVRQAVYPNLRWPITATGYITLTPTSDFTLYVDMNGDGAVDTTVTPIITEQTLDFTPPAQVQDLAARVVSTGTVELTWTAPGDDLMTGRATLYEIRYYTEPITLRNWPDAYSVVTTTEPITAGQVQTLMVSDLPTGEWYFALRAVDEMGNAGLVSNSPGVTVVGYPRGDVDRNCVVDERDIRTVAQAWRKSVWDEDWDARWDVREDGFINVLDVLQVGMALTQQCASGP